jgi:hypothetical protein
VTGLRIGWVVIIVVSNVTLLIGIISPCQFGPRAGESTGRSVSPILMASRDAVDWASATECAMP